MAVGRALSVAALEAISSLVLLGFEGPFSYKLHIGLAAALAAL